VATVSLWCAADPPGFFLLAMINISLFHVARHHLAAYPSVQGKVVKALLIPLAIADVSIYR
jgi:hypothetical protein